MARVCSFSIFFEGRSPLGREEELEELFSWNSDDYYKYTLKKLEEASPHTRRSGAAAEHYFLFKKKKNFFSHFTHKNLPVRTSKLRYHTRTRAGAHTHRILRRVA